MSVDRWSRYEPHQRELFYVSSSDFQSMSENHNPRTSRPASQSNSPEKRQVEINRRKILSLHIYKQFRIALFGPSGFMGYRDLFSLGSFFINPCSDL